MNPIPSARRERVAWAVFGLAVTALVGYVVLAFVGAVLVGLFLYYATRRVRDWLAERRDHPTQNAAVALLAVGVPLLCVLGYAALVGAREVSALLAAYQLQELRSLLQPYVSLSSAAQPGRLLDLFRGNAGQVLAYAGAIFGGLSRVFVGLVVAFLLLRDDDSLSGWFERSVGADHDAVRFLAGVDDDLETVYTGNLLTVLITMAVAAVTFYAFNAVAPGSPTIRFPLLLGLLVGVFTLVPVVGVKAVWVPYAGVLLVRSLVLGRFPLWVPVAFVVVTAVVVDFLPDFFVRSWVSSGEINMGLMLLSYMLGVLVFGWYGLFFGPLLLVVFLHFARRVFPHLVDRASVGLVEE